MTLRVLHVLDHSIPLHSGYTFRTRAILREQRRLGWETFHLTGPKHSASSGPEEDVDGLHFYRTLWRPEGLATLLGLSEIASDCDLDNEPSLRAHQALGFAEAVRVICLRKAL